MQRPSSRPLPLAAPLRACPDKIFALTRGPRAYLTRCGRLFAIIYNSVSSVRTPIRSKGLGRRGDKGVDFFFLFCFFLARGCHCVVIFDAGEQYRGWFGWLSGRVHSVGLMMGRWGLGVWRTHFLLVGLFVWRINLRWVEGCPLGLWWACTVGCGLCVCRARVGRFSVIDARAKCMYILVNRRALSISMGCRVDGLF